MTVNQLIKKLAKLQAEHGNATVTADVGSLRDSLGNLKDDCSIAPVTKVAHQWVYLADDDGGVAMTQKGRERGSMQIVLG